MGDVDGDGDGDGVALNGRTAEGWTDGVMTR